MAPHRDALKKYGSRAIAAAILIGGGLILAGLPALGKGLIAGAFFSILNFILIAESLPHKLGKSRRKASAVSMGWILLRYALMAVPLILALEFHLFHPLTAAIGLFFVQLAILCDHFFMAFNSSSGTEA
jgi:hypothetical protein